MPFSPALLGCLMLSAVFASGIVAQVWSAPRHTIRPAAAAPAIAAPAPRAPTRPAPVRRAAVVRTHHPTTLGESRTSHGRAVLYLTFDDGPQEVWTPKVLSVLATHHAKATFFVLGKQAIESPDLLARIRAAGHSVGNHTYDHRKLTQLGLSEARWELERGPRSRCFRPPFRETNARIVALAASYRMRQVLWDVDTEDWRRPGTAAIEAAILHGASPGVIVLLHDGGGDRSQTVAALDRALGVLSGRGYVFRALPC